MQSHRGYDPGALSLSKDLAKKFAAPLYASTISRLLVDLNRSLSHPRLYSEMTRQVPKEVQHKILSQYYFPYRNRIEGAIADLIAANKRVIHISSHSFTPVLDGIVRNADVGVLYDPNRLNEREWCKAFCDYLKLCMPGLKVRKNYPYAGRADGLVTYFRRRFVTERYIGIELEINQRCVFGDPVAWREMRQGLSEALNQLVTPKSNAGK